MTETLKVQATESAGSDDPVEVAKHNAEMVRIADGGDINEKPTAIPEGGVDKFFDKDKGSYNWEAHAKDSDFRSNQSDTDKAKAKEGGDDETVKAAETESEAAKALESKGLDLAPFSAEFAEKGALTEESYGKLGDAGFPKELVDQFIAGQQAVADATRASVYSTIGGEDNFTAMSEWAAENATPDDLAAYNKAVTSGDAATTKMAVEALFGRYTEATGSAPKLLSPGETNPTSGSVFRSWDEVTKAMSDARYGPDPAYTDDLIAKLDRSKL